MSGRDWVSAMLEAVRRRRSIAAEAFRATLAELPGVLVQVEPLNADAECAPGGGNGRRREHLGAPGRRALGGHCVRRGVSRGLR